MPKTHNQTNAGTYSTHYISGTHWDREWYRPFQEFRVLLVQLMDELLELMEENDDFRYFQLDGQTCVLEDYLEVRPENRDRLARLIEEGDILIGPWFTMPDLFCPGQESLVRNLLMGKTISEDWGTDPMPVAYTCDMFGHPAQMPQIYRGFDLDDCVLGRGTNEHTTPPFFTWQAPDGSEVFTFKLQDAMGYGAFAKPRLVLEKPEEFAQQNDDFAAEMKAADSDEERQNIQEQWFRQAMSDYVDHELERATAPVICLMDAIDHIPPANEVERYLRLINESCSQVDPLHSNMPDFFRDAQQKTGDLPVKSGELREPSKENCGYLWLIPNCVSSRIRMKQANDACESLVQRWAEPLTAFANLDAEQIPERFLRIAWKHILLNHAHDSICGCSIDQVHRDMMYRYDQALELGDQLRQQGISALTNDFQELGQSEDEFTLILSNPLPRDREEVVEFDVDLPSNYPTEFRNGFSAPAIKAFRLEDAEGNEVPYQRLSQDKDFVERSNLARFCYHNDGPCERYRIAAKVSLPALGFTSLRVVPSETAVRRASTLRTGPRCAENEHLRVRIQNNGTLSVTDRATGENYNDLLTLEDRSEVGDGWFHAHGVNDEQLLSSTNEGQVAIVHEGPEQVTFRSTLWIHCPTSYSEDNDAAGDHTTKLKVSHYITLRRAAQSIDVRTVVDNTAEDHRLRLLLPTDCADADTWLGHTPYHVTERDIEIDPQTTDWQEMEQAEKPIQGFQAVHQKGRGLAFVSGGGLHEGGVMDDVRRTMHITLLRSFRKTVSTSGEKDGLERGRLEYSYSIRPYAGELPDMDIIADMERLETGILTRQSGQRSSGFPALQEEKGVTERSYLQQMDHTLAISAIKPGENTNQLIIRLWNPGEHPRTETLHFFRPVTSATDLKLNEEQAEGESSLTVNGNEVTVQAAPHKIVTVGVELE